MSKTIPYIKLWLIAFAVSGMAAGTALAVTPVLWLRASESSTNGAYVLTAADAFGGTNNFHSPPPPSPNVSDPTNYYRPVYSAEVPRQGRVLDPITGTLYENTRSFQFDRNNTRAERLLSSTYDWDAFNFGTNSFTIEFFAKTGGTNTWYQPDRCVFGDMLNDGWILSLDGSRWRCASTNGTNDWISSVSLTTVTAPNRWSHHALVFDREAPGDHHVHIYVDYNLIQTVSFSTNAFYRGNNYFEIGNYLYSTGGSIPGAYAGWHGFIDEIRIMIGALTTNQFLRMVPFRGTMIMGH